MKKKKKKISLGPVFTILIITGVIALFSTILSLLQLQGDLTSISNGYLETSTISVKNILSVDGLKFIISNSINNFMLFEPLFLLIVSLIGIGIGEKSGLFKAACTPFRKIKTSIINFTILFISICATFLGEYSFAILIPFAGVIYKYTGKNPLLGILTAFIGTTIGYAAGIMCNYDTVSLGILTQAAARVDVDSTYTFNIFSSIYIMIVSTIILTIIGNIIIMKVLYPKLPKEKEAIEEDLVVSKKALGISNIAMIIMIIFIAYGITPKIFGGGFLLDKSGDNYISMLLSDSAPFKNSIIFIITFIIMVCGYIYGKISKNINNSTDYSVGLSKSFDKLGYVFVLSFFASQMVAILDWTGIDDVLCSIIVDLISKAQFSGLPLILITMLFLLLIGIIMPNTYDKWVIISPIMVPLFMRSNIAPEFTQFIFQVVDGVSKSISPIFMYFIILLAFLEKYSKSETKITVFGTIKTILPTVLLLLGVWILIITGWYIIGLPLGVGTSITL